MNVFIGCSSKDNLNQIYIDTAIELATYLSNKNYNLICGGNDGLMNILNNIFTGNKKNTTIFSVATYHDDNIKSNSIKIYNTIAERKQNLLKEANIIIFLPGGIGTLDEIFTAIESKRAKEHQNPIIIININNYYDDLINQLNKMNIENFSTEEDKQYYYITNNIKETINYIEQLGDNNE